jgi:PAS domain S-box-containing protein
VALNEDDSVAAEAIFESSPDAILIVDQQGQVRQANKQAEFLFGYSAKELKSKAVEELLPESLRAVHKEHRRNYQDDPRPRPMGLGLNIIGLRADGREALVDAALAPVVAPTGVFTIVTIRRRTTKEAGVIPQLFRIISGKNPFQAWLMVFLFLASFPLLFNAPAPNSIQAVVPHWTVLIWAAMLSSACVVNLMGVYWRAKIEVAVWLEMSSCLGIALTNLLYPASIITFAFNVPGSSISAANIWYVITLLLGISISAMGRFYQLLQDRREVSQVKKLIRAAGVSS